MEDLKKSDLLMDGEVAIQPEGSEQPFIYRGFRMVDEEKLRELRGDELRKMNQNGMLPIIYAHLFSLSQMREVFGRQMQQGKAPQPGAVSRLPRRLKRLTRPPSRIGGRAGLRPSSTASASISAATRSKSRPGHFERRVEIAAAGRSRSAARGRRAPDARDGR